MMRPSPSYTVGARLPWLMDAIRARFGASGYPVAQLAARLAFDRHTLGRGTTGYDVARRARQLNGGLPVVYITSHDLHASRFGVEDGVLMLKPFLPSELALRVKGLIGPALDATEASRPIMGPGAGLALAPNGDAPDP